MIRHVLALALAIALLLAAFVWVAFTTPGFAQGMDHTAPGHWYDAECCSQRDCAPIPPETVTITPWGYELRLVPGHHPLVTMPTQRDFAVDSNDVKPSQDGEYHACVPPAYGTAEDHGPRGQAVYCLYVPQFGV